MPSLRLVEYTNTTKKAKITTMVKEKEDILEIKPGIYGFHINLIALWRRLFSSEKENPVLVVPKRVLQIFKQHDVAASQIPRLIPQLSLVQVSSPQNLLSALTPDIIQQVADLFQIQTKWLEGETNRIYDDRYYCYKDPWKFFEDIETFKIETFEEPLIAFTSVSKFDCKSGKDQIVLLVQREKCADLDGKKIYRYRIIERFLWGYFKTRIQLKAMIRIWYKRFEIPVHIYQISKKELNSMESGKMVPDAYLKRSKRLKHIALEDFCLTPDEDRISKENDDLPEVFEYIKIYKLENMEGENPRFSQSTAQYR